MQNIEQNIHEKLPQLPIATIQLPDGHSLNDMLVNYGGNGIKALLDESEKQEINVEKLKIDNPNKISYQGKAANYIVVGQLPTDFGNMKISLQIIEPLTEKRHRLKLDLFDTANIHRQIIELSEKQQLDMNVMIADLTVLADLLEIHREKLYDEESIFIPRTFSEKELTPKASEKAIEFLSSPNLLKNIDKLLEQSGIVGEEDNRKILFVLASSYKMPQPLHSIIQGTSGNGKSHLINSVADCMPQEDVMNLTRITSKSLYHYQEKELTNKLILIQDFDGLDEEAQYAFREAQSAKFLTSSTVVKDKFGNTRGKTKSVTAHFASLSATTKAEVYYDNASRSVMLGLDESDEQTMKIIARQNTKRAGNVNIEDEQQAKQLLRNCIRVLKSSEVVNPYAEKLKLPLEARMLRRLNEQFQGFVSQIVILHQFQRKSDSKGRLIATKEDIEVAVNIFFSAIIIKIDELDSATRQFFERVKAYVGNQINGTSYKFTAREIRQELNQGKTYVHNYLKSLQELEYIQIAEGSENRGYKYKISYWDNMEKLKTRIKNDLQLQLKDL